MAGVYISYPFCAQKCSFCNFASGVSTSEVKTRYLRLLLSQIRDYDWRSLPETLYLGGGTPSLMALADLRRILAAIPSEGLVEVTIECAPGTVTLEMASGWKLAGVNRVSLGVQSFVAAELRQTGRRHTAETVANDVALLRTAGIDSINVDLIAGLPGQTLGSWNISLDWVERLAPPHVSVYLFELDEDSRLGKEALLGGKRYGANLLPDDDLAADLYELAVARLASIGIERYEISNFARPGFESKHNLKYWQLEPYVGFGLDAHSFDGRVRSSTPDTLEGFFKRTGRAFTEVDQSEEHFFVGLRLTAGIEPTAQEWLRFAGPIAKWLDAGLLERSGARLRLSDRGFLLSNEVLQEFIDVETICV